MRQRPVELKGKTDKCTILVEDLSTTVRETEENGKV
jgi:hypothetical protein